MSRFGLLGADTVGVGNALVAPIGNPGNGSGAVVEHASEPQSTGPSRPWSGWFSLGAVPDNWSGWAVCGAFMNFILTYQFCNKVQW